MPDPIRWKAEVSFLNTQGRSLEDLLTLRDLNRFNDCQNVRNAALCQRLEAIYALLSGTAQFPREEVPRSKQKETQP